MPKRYKNDMTFYDHTLRCECCGADVDPEDLLLEPRTETYENDAGETITVPYRVAICPECDDVICSRELGYNLAKYMRRYLEDRGKL